jgi:uncharacterized protein with GYD domain
LIPIKAEVRIGSNGFGISRIPRKLAGEVPEVVSVIKGLNGADHYFGRLAARCRLFCLILELEIRDAAMLTFVMLTRLSPEAVRSPKALEDLERQAMERVRKECPDVEWVISYAILGPCDYLDIFRAKDIETASKVSTLVRTFGHAHTEIWTATDWDRFKEIVRTL